MQIDLPEEAIEKARLLAQDGEDAATVFVTALERLELERREVAAVLEGVAAYERGDHEPWQDFAKRFREENGIAAE